MARKNEFRPDRERLDNLGKLLLTKKQSRSLLRWVLFAVVCVVGLLVQDVALYRLSFRGACAEIMPCLIMMVAIMQGAESGCVFALVMSCLYHFSGSAPGTYVIPLITVSAVLVSIFRQGNLRQGFGAIFLCAAAGMFLYEMSVFGFGLFLELTTAERLPALALTALMSLLVVPVAYPLLLAIGKIGGETWKE